MVGFKIYNNVNTNTNLNTKSNKPIIFVLGFIRV